MRSVIVVVGLEKYLDRFARPERLLEDQEACEDTYF
jgi:hypothetical protein